MKSLVEDLLKVFHRCFSHVPNDQDPKGATFKNQEGRTIDRPDAIVPLISFDNNSSEYYFIGTAFYVTWNGLLINKYLRREILMENVFISGDYDIAYLMPVALSDKENQPLMNSTLELSDISPEVGDQLSTYAYPNSGIIYFDSGDSHHIFNGDFFLGKCNVVDLN